MSEGLGMCKFSRQLQTISHHNFELFYNDLSFEKSFSFIFWFRSQCGHMEV